MAEHQLPELTMYLATQERTIVSLGNNDRVWPLVAPGLLDW